MLTQKALLAASRRPGLRRLVTGNPASRRVVGRFVAGETLADFTERVSRSAACQNGGFALEPAELDGEPAEQRIFECDVWDWLQITAIHGDRGYVMWLVATAPPLAHERPINQQWLEGFRFTD